MKKTIIVSAILLMAVGISAMADEQSDHEFRTNAVVLFAKTSGGAISLEAVKYIQTLKLKGQLPGIVSNTPAAVEIPWLTFDGPGGQAYFINTNQTFPVLLTLTVHANDVADRYHYTITKTAKTNDWQLQHAWCSDTNGIVLKRFSVLEN